MAGFGVRRRMVEYIAKDAAIVVAFFLNLLRRPVDVDVDVDVDFDNRFTFLSNPNPNLDMKDLFEDSLLLSCCSISC